MKELQGQFKADFKKFVTDNYYNTILCVDPNTIIQNFNSLKIEFQFGVVQLFADSVGKPILVDTDHTLEVKYCAHIFCLGFSDLFYTRPEAQQEAITQFEKWYNEQR